MAAKKTAKKKATKKTTTKRAKAAPKKKETFRTYSALSRVIAARKNRTLPRGTVVMIDALPTMKDDMENVKVRIGAPKKGTFFEIPLTKFLSESIKALGFAQDDDAGLPAFGTAVTAN